MTAKRVLMRTQGLCLGVRSPTYYKQKLQNLK